LRGDSCPKALCPVSRYRVSGLVERVGYYNIEKYEYIRNWIKEYREREKPSKYMSFSKRFFRDTLV